jgi:hypothetical protein
VLDSRTHLHFLHLGAVHIYKVSPCWSPHSLKPSSGTTNADKGGKY